MMKRSLPDGIVTVSPARTWLARWKWLGKIIVARPLAPTLNTVMCAGCPQRTAMLSSFPMR